MKIGFVVHRYGPEIKGGAEAACRDLAVRVAERPGTDVEVFTTCATDTDWTQGYTPGTGADGAATVHRFAATPRHPGFHDLSTALLTDRHPATASPAEQQQWLAWQGPVSRELVDAAVGSDADLLVFTPYLYWPTVEGVRRAGDRAVLHPAAHDEPAIHLPVFHDVFTSPRALVFFSDAERRAVERLFPVATSRQTVLGIGVDPPDVPADPAAFRAAAGLDDRPYLVCVGRVDPGKGTTALADLFATYKRHHPGPLALALVGPVVEAPDPHPDVVVTGPVDEAVKWSAFAGATAFVHPSRFESFSIVLMEAWAAGLPALVNARCDVTVEHARRSRGGLWFGGYATFEAAVHRLTHDDGLARRLGTAGRHHVERWYRWPSIVDRYLRFVSAG